MKKELHQIALRIALITGLTVSPAFGDKCPIPPTSVYPEVTVKVTYDKKTRLYIYDYTLTNGSNSKLPIGNLTLKIPEKPFESSSPTHKWISSFDEGGEDVPANFSWITASEDVQPGGKKTGFVLKSYRAPGPIRCFVLGETELRVGTPTPEDDEPIPDCPGFYDDAPGFDDRVSGIVDGPAPEKQVAVDLKLMDSKGEKDCGPISPYEDKGSINVLLKVNKGLKVSDIDLKSLHFGVGQAPLVSSQRMGTSEEVILLRFDTQKVAIECERDRVLFLSGKTTDGKILFGGAVVKTKNCDKRPKRKQAEHRKRPTENRH